MKLTRLALLLLAGIGSGCAIAPPASIIAAADLPNCFDSNHDAQRNLFTMRNAAQDAVNQQCALQVGPRGGAASRGLAAGRYTVTIANGGAGGTMQAPRGGGGAGGGGAGARETQTTVQLAEGVYRLTMGAGGPGGNACVFAPYHIGGGPGWLGSPSSIVRIANGAVVAGTPGADSYARPSRAQHDQSAGRMDGHGGSGPGQTSGGHGGDADSALGGAILAEAGQSRQSAGNFLGQGGIPGGNEDRTTAGGGGGATSRADGGGGGGESPGHANRPAQRGTLGSGGGGGEGSRFECDAGARGGHGYIALRPIQG